MDDEQGEPKGSPQALTNITRSLKRLAQRFDIPIVGTTQVLSWKIGLRHLQKQLPVLFGNTLQCYFPALRWSVPDTGTSRHADCKIETKRSP